MSVINAVIAENALNTVTPGPQLYSEIEANNEELVSVPAPALPPL